MCKKDRLHQPLLAHLKVKTRRARTNASECAAVAVSVFLASSVRARATAAPFRLCCQRCALHSSSLREVRACSAKPSASGLYCHRRRHRLSRPQERCKRGPDLSALDELGRKGVGSTHASARPLVCPPANFTCTVREALPRLSLIHRCTCRRTYSLKTA